MPGSGVDLHPDALAVYNEFKKSTSTIAFVTYTIEGNYIVVSEIVQKSELKEILASEDAKEFKQMENEPDDWACLRYTLTKGQSLPRYATCFLHYNDSTGGQAKVSFFTWCRDDAPIKLRMLISSSKDAIGKKLDGIQYYIQANDEDELNFFDNAKGVSKGDAKF